MLKRNYLNAFLVVYRLLRVYNLVAMEASYHYWVKQVSLTAYGLVAVMRINMADAITNNLVANSIIS